MYRLGFDIGGTKINAGIISYENGNTEIVALRKIEVRTVTNVLEDIKLTVLDMCRESGIEYSEIDACGAGVPGTVSSDGRKILKVPNIAILSEDFADRLSDTLGIPVTMVQDSRAAAWGEYLCGAGRGAKSVVCVTLGTGIGTGIVLDGKIYDGALGCAGELGHTVAVENGRECGCTYYYS